MASMIFGSRTFPAYGTNCSCLSIIAIAFCLIVWTETITDWFSFLQTRIWYMATNLTSFPLTTTHFNTKYSRLRIPMIRTRTTRTCRNHRCSVSLPSPIRSYWGQVRNLVTRRVIWRRARSLLRQIQARIQRWKLWGNRWPQLKRRKMGIRE